MTRRIVDIAPQAKRDIVEITRASRNGFGEPAAIRYRDLIIAGIVTPADQPAQRAAKDSPGCAGGAWT